MITVFNGPPGTGKDEGCNFFESKGYKHLSFKHELFKETIKYYGVSFDWFMLDYDNRDIKEQKEHILCGLSRREALIHVSENIIKPKFGAAYFGIQAAEQLEKGVQYCFSDGGFIDELVPIINKVGVENISIVQLIRDGCDFSSDSRRYFDGKLAEDFVITKESKIPKSHILPQKFPIRTYRIHNNGTLEQFITVLNTIYEKEQDVVQGTKEKEKNFL